MSRRNAQAKFRRALKYDAPRTFGERLAVALVTLKPPKSTRRPWTRAGWLAKRARVGREIYAWLKDYAKPRGMKKVRRLAAVLGVSPQWLLSGTDSK